MQLTSSFWHSLTCNNYTTHRSSCPRKNVQVVPDRMQNTSWPRQNGLIISLQFSDNGTALWIVSGRWRVDINYDINGVVPQSIKNLNVSLGMISADGLVTKKYSLSDFKESTASYDKQTHLATINGTLRILMGTQAIDNVRTTLKFFERNIVSIRLDPSKTNDDFGDTPIYGVKRGVQVRKNILERYPAKK